MSGQCAGNPIEDESRIAFIIKMLKLTAATGWEVATWWGLVVRSGYNGAIRRDPVPRCCQGEMAALIGDAIAACGYSNDRFGYWRFGHRHSPIA